MQCQRTSVSVWRRSWFYDYNGVFDLGRIFCRIFNSCSLVAVRSLIGCDKREGSVLSGGYFEGSSDVDLDGEGPR